MIHGRETQRNYAVPIFSIFAGILSWLIVALLVGDVDPMRHKQYLIIGYPLLLLTAIYLGWTYGLKAWHCGFWMLGIQLLVGLLTIKSDLNLLPIGLVIFAALAAILSLAAVVSGIIAKQFTKAR